jgi:colanic acid/amylovoran biosynthesis glycosyltransferase
MAAVKPRRIAYLIHTFPLFSLTFIVDEIEAMRDMGAQIDLYGVRLPQADEYPDDYQKYCDETTYALPVKLLRHIAGHAKWIFLHPIKYLSCLWFVLTASKCSLKERVKLVGYLCEAVALADQIKPRNYDHLHVHFLFGGSLVALFLKKLTGIKYSATGHGTDFLVDRWLLHEKVCGAEFVRIGTQFNANFIKKAIAPAIANELFVLPFGIDHKSLIDSKHVIIEKIEQRNNEPIVIINVGRLVWQKGQATLIESARILKDKGLNFRLEIIGEGELRVEIEALIARYCLQEHVVMRGALPRNDVLKAMQAADIFAFSSLSEGFGIVLLEAMLCGLAVVAPNITGVSEIVMEGKTGIIYPSQTGSVLASSLEQLIINKKLRQSYQLNALDDVCARFDHLDKVAQLYKRMTLCE